MVRVFKEPLKRIIAPLVDGRPSGMNGRFGDSLTYTLSLSYAENLNGFVEAALVLQKDLVNLFEYVSPSSQNFDTFSIQIHQLLVRVCIEIEANFKAILIENGYSKRGNLNITDYKRVGEIAALSFYEVKIHGWTETADVFAPFSGWSDGKTPMWWVGYNAAKHDRSKEFHQANFGNLVNAFCALFSLLAAQIHFRSFEPPSFGITIIDGEVPDFYPMFARRFLIKFPPAERYRIRYDFDTTGKFVCGKIPWDEF